MSKLTYNKDDIVRAQYVGGGTIELHGKFAGDILAEIEEMSMVNLRTPGHNVVAVTGGMVSPIDQRELKLDDKDKRKDKKNITKAEQFMANVAPSADVMQMFADALTGKKITAATYNEDTANYEIVCEPTGKDVKGKPKQKTLLVSIVTCRIKEYIKEDPKVKKLPDNIDLPEPKETKPKKKIASSGRTTILDGQAQKKLSKELSDKDSMSFALRRACMDEDDRQQDRWSYLKENGADDSHILTHIREVFGSVKKQKEFKHGKKISATVGGQRVQFWYDMNHKPANTVPTLEGDALVHSVRWVLGIPLTKAGE